MTAYPFYMHILLSVLRPSLAPLRFPVTASFTMCSLSGRVCEDRIQRPLLMYSVGLTSVSMQWQAAGNSLDFVRLISSYGFKLRHAVTLLLGQGRALLQLTQGSLGARAMDSSSGMHELLSQYTNQPVHRELWRTQQREGWEESAALRLQSGHWHGVELANEGGLCGILKRYIDDG